MQVLATKQFNFLTLRMGYCSSLKLYFVDVVSPAYLQPLDLWGVHSTQAAAQAIFDRVVL